MGMRMVSDFFVPCSASGEFWTDERCYITELHNTDASPDASLAVARVKPGVTTQLHRLDGICERYIVRKGAGILEVDGRRQPITMGDQAVIAAGAAQRIENTGTDDLEFYCLCTPRFVQSSYVNLE
jgi:mannose-6-phosphate isomerase-like protein (cupin superfamily)